MSAAGAMVLVRRNGWGTVGLNELWFLDSDDRWTAEHFGELGESGPLIGLRRLESPTCSPGTAGQAPLHCHQGPDEPREQSIDGNLGASRGGEMAAGTIPGGHDGRSS